MPPPNITGQLHIGHGLDTTIQDAVIRFRRMQGYEALWMPGTDHASIATEVKIVDQLVRGGPHERGDRTRRFFRARMGVAGQVRQDRSVEQLKKLGFFLRLAKRALYNGRGLQQGRNPHVCTAI